MSRYLRNNYVNHFRNNSKLCIGAFINIVRNSLACEVSPSQAYTTKKKALKQIQRTYINQYAKLQDYCVEMKRTNLRSTVIMKIELVEDKVVFQMINICFDACKRGFLSGYRPMFGLDGCPIKGLHSRQLLTIVGIDLNNQIFIICYVVIEVESKDSWF